MDGLLQTERKVFPVVVENIAALWPQLELLVKRSLRGIETHTTDDIRRAIEGGGAHLWVQWSDRLEAFVVTEFVAYPRGTWLRLWLAATAPDAELDDEKFEDVLAQWRDANECRGFEVIGRLGWLRRFADARFVGAIMRTTVS